MLAIIIIVMNDSLSSLVTLVSETARTPSAFPYSDYLLFSADVPLTWQSIDSPGVHSLSLSAATTAAAVGMPLCCSRAAETDSD
jgi:hypothetical protein